jgi:putative DNA primase/helicase
MNDIEQARSALASLDPSCPYDEWIRILMSAKAARLSFDDFHNWSKNGGNYQGEKDCHITWKSFNETGGITAATLFQKALNNGRKNAEKLHFYPAQTSHRNSNHQKKSNHENRTQVNDNLRALKIWERCLPALATHEYIVSKQGKPDGLRYYPSTEPSLMIGGTNVANYLVVPCLDDGKLQTLQFIPPSGGKKLNLDEAKFNNGYFVVGDISKTTSEIYLTESTGNAWAIFQATSAPVVVAFGSGRMSKVAEVIRAKYSEVILIVVPDRGGECKAAEIAKAIDGQWIKLPQDKPKNYDVNDCLLEHGENTLRNLLAHPEMPLNVIFADKLSPDFTAPDELVEGMLIAGDGSILYGDSNSGKTFFVIDLACAIARGVDWFGRKTEPGLVIYLAAESPASVRRRLQAYQKHHNVRVINFAIVQSPVDLFDGEADTDAIIQTVRLLEKQCGQKARLIVGDTLARLSAGANENAGQDMGLVVRHFDRIRNECNAHFMLIHHSGKNAAAGARGWSGVRAAVDTEIEVTDSSAGRCAEITKQRDLDTKGARIGFSLEPIKLGLTKWRSQATSCVVIPADAPKKQSSKRLSEIAGAIVEYLLASKNCVKKAELVKHFANRYSSSGIYRETKKLVEAGQVSDSFGYVKIIVPTDAN